MSGVQEDLREEESRQPQASGQPSRSIDDYRAIFHIWPDFPVNACITQSIATVKVDAARHSFSAMGRNIVWAVMDTGIDAQHRHFDLHQNLSMNERFHHDFTVEPEELGHELEDKNGHGTHVAGIIAGELVASNTTPPITSSAQYRNENGDIETAKTNLSKISGMAPCCKLVSLKVLNDSAKGNSSAVIKAIRHVPTD
ncbi:MAG: S8 family serine peptidase [Candidatus Moraniibacteriota bacterium]